MALRKTLFVLEDFTVGTPGQQLLDRFLIGYSHDGDFRRNPGGEVGIWLAPVAEQSTAFKESMNGLAMRRRDFNLVQHPTLEAALREPGNVIVVGDSQLVCPSRDLIESIIERLPANAACFICGCIATRRSDAEHLLTLAANRGASLVFATAIATTFRLPEVSILSPGAVSEALIIVNGPKPLAELAGIDALSILLAGEPGHEVGIQLTRRFEGRRLWRAGEEGLWSKELLAAAISRSNSTQGDAVRDGRTQDLVGLGLVEKLAKEPRGWIIQLRNGARATILVLDGVVADINFAVRSVDGAIHSAQIYRPPAPVCAEFDSLAAMIEDFFTTRMDPWPKERALLLAQFMEKVIW